MDQNQAKPEHETATLSEKSKNPLLIPFLIALVGVILTVSTLFLPFATATPEYREYLLASPDDYYAEEIGMTKRDAVNISLFEFWRMYAAAYRLGLSETIALVCLIIISVFAGFVLLTLLFVVLKKATPAIIFDILSFAVLRLIRWDFSDRGVLPDSMHDWGIASLIAYVGMIIVIVGALLLLIAKVKAKRAAMACISE